MKKDFMIIDAELSYYCEDGEFTSYTLTAEGNNLEEMLEDATICEISDDEIITTYSTRSAPIKVASAAYDAIQNYLEGEEAS